MNIIPKHDHYETGFDRWAAAYWCTLIAILICVLVMVNRQSDLIERVDRLKEKQMILNDRFTVETPWRLQGGKIEVE